LKPDVQLDPGQLLGLLGLGPSSGKTPDAGTATSTNALSQGLAAAATALGGQPGGMPGAAALAGGPAGGLLQAQATGFIETLKRSVREVRVTVSWRDGKDERSVSASQELVILPESVGKAGQVQVQPQQQPAPVQPGQLPRPVTARPSADGDSQ
jgi:general secretion pathway protein I